MPGIYEKIQTVIPTAASDQGDTAVRSTAYGDTWHIPTQPFADAQANEGCRFVGMGTTPNTSILTPNNTSLTETSPCLLIYNASISKTYIIDFVRVVNTVIPTSSTDCQMVCAVDSINRYTSGGTALNPFNNNMQSLRDSNANVVFGNITASAASSSRRFLEFLVVKTAVITARDVFVFNFAQNGTSLASIFANNSSTVSIYSFNLGPVAIGPGQSFLMYLYYATSAAASSYIPVVSWLER